MSRVIQIDVVLGMIDQAEQQFALNAARNKPDGDHAAYFNHGVVVGMDTVRKNILAKLKEADADGAVSGATKGGRTNVYA